MGYYWQVKMEFKKSGKQYSFRAPGAPMNKSKKDIRNWHRRLAKRKQLNAHNEKIVSIKKVTPKKRRRKRR